MKDLRFVKAPEMLRVTQERRKASQMKDSDWNAFQIDYAGDVDAQITQLLADCEASIKSWKGIEPNPPATPETPLIPEDAELDKQPLALLQAEIARLEKLVAADAVTKKSSSLLSQPESPQKQLRLQS